MACLQVDGPISDGGVGVGGGLIIRNLRYYKVNWMVLSEL